MTKEIPRFEAVEKRAEIPAGPERESGAPKCVVSEVDRLFQDNQSVKKDMLVLLESSGLSRKDAACILNLEIDPRSCRTRITR